jgi:hypothetical protein
MKYFILIAVFFFMFIENQMAQRVGDSISFIKWEKVVINNYATFNSRDTVNWGSGFLIKYRNDTIACTARDFTGTLYTRGKILYIKDFDKELKYW